MSGNHVRHRFDRLGPRQRGLVLPKRDLALHAMITSAGYECRTLDAQGSGAGYDWHGLRRGPAEFALFQYTFSGGGLLTYEGAEHVVRPGQVILLHFPHDNRYRLGDRAPRRAAGLRHDGWRFFYLCLNGSEVLRAWRRAVDQLGPLVELRDDDALLNEAATTCLAVLRQEIRSPWDASARAYSLAMRLLERVGARRGEGHGDRHRPPAVARAIAYAREHLDAHTAVTDLAEVAGLSRFHFTRVFQASEGLSPSEFLIRERLRRAVRMLQTTDEPIKTIAHACGFRDANYFSKSFRKHYGLAPGELRASGMY